MIGELLELLSEFVVVLLLGAWMADVAGMFKR
jgi:hypothetical protein